MIVSNVSIYGRKLLLGILPLFVMSGCLSFRFFMRYMQEPSNGILFGNGLFFLIFIFCLIFLLYLLAGKKHILCGNEVISIKSSFFTIKDRHITLSKNDCLLLQCEESERFERYDIFHSRVRMSIIPIYYVIKIENNGELILRFSEKQAAIETFDYICRSFPAINKRVDFGDENRILKVRKLLWLMILKNFLLFVSIVTGLVSIVLCFCSYCIHADVFEKNWERCNIYVVREHADNAYVRVRISKQSKELTCSVLSNDLSTLRDAAKKREEIAAYIAFGNSPELRLSSPNATNFVLFISMAGGMLFVSISLFYLFIRTKNKLLLEAPVTERGNTLLYW